MTPNIIAFDLSLTCTGVAHHEGAETLKPSANSRGMHRLYWIREEVLQRTRTLRIDVAVLEGYAFGRANQAHQLGELGGVIRLALWEERIPVAIVQPSCVKKYATGNGNAAKELMLVSAVKKLGYGGSSNDEADAMWLRTMAVAHYSGFTAACTVKQLEALYAVEWPVVAMAGAA